MILMHSCAQIRMPQGGSKDMDAPVISKENSTPNKQTNFSDREIEFQFNEWVQVSNPSKEVFVSPPLAYPPKVSTRGKGVVFEFSENEVLKENTTYQINFGKAIKDLTEGNVVENLVFLFSTGDEIDSLSVKGKVQNALTGQPEKDIVVLLYDDLSDTCFTLVKPLYLTRTDNQGEFSLENLRADTFQIFALEDQNVSYTYDVQTERVAFLDTLIILEDTLTEKIVLQLFDEEDSPKFIEAKQRRQGMVNILYQSIPDSMDVRVLDSDTTMIWQEMVEDTLKIWHDALGADSLVFEVSHNQLGDTIKVKKGRKTFDKSKLRLKTRLLNLLAKDTIRLEFNLPVKDVDLTMITLQDTIKTFTLTELGVDGRFVYLNADSLKADQNYKLVLDSLSVNSWYDNQYVDSVSIIVKTMNPENFGNILLGVNKPDTLAYVVQLKSKEEIVGKIRLDEQSELRFMDLASGKYSITIIQDLDNNGKWSAGNLAEKKLPEKTKELTLEDLKLGWDLEADLDIEALFYGTEGK